MASKKKGAGGNLTRSQIITVRLDPKLKYAAELCARKQRRTISSFVEWAVQEAANGVMLNENKSMNEVMNQVWDIEEVDRFVKLALNYPELLTYEEEKLWKIIKEHPPFWKQETGKTNKKSPEYQLIRMYWEILQKIVAGEATSEKLSEVPF